MITAGFYQGANLNVLVNQEGAGNGVDSVSASCFLALDQRT